MKSDGAGKSHEPLPDERRLVDLARSGDAEAFGQLYDVYVDRVYRYIFFRVTDEGTAEDLTSQVFLKAWESVKRYRPRGPFIAWLYTISRNAVIDHYRTRRQTVSLDAAVPVASQDEKLDDHVQLQFEMSTLQEVLQTLTDEQQQVLIMKFIAGFPTDEIAREMKKSEGAIRALQMRALQALAKEMEARDEE